MENKIFVTVKFNGDIVRISAFKGDNLRKTLIQNNVSPYSKINRKLNCGGNGICATCGVFIIGNTPNSTHWHDKLAAKFYYPRLSCQITIEEDMEIEIPKKMIWGKRRFPNK